MWSLFEHIVQMITVKMNNVQINSVQMNRIKNDISPKHDYFIWTHNRPYNDFHMNMIISYKHDMVPKAVFTSTRLIATTRLFATQE